MIGFIVKTVLRFALIGLVVLLGTSSGGLRGVVGSLFLLWIFWRAGPGLWKDIKWVWSAGGKKFSSIKSGSFRGRSNQTL